MALGNGNKPKNYNRARQNESWQKAMESKMKSKLQNDILDLENQLTNCSLSTPKQVYKEKIGANGSIQYNKKLFARDYEIDCDEVLYQNFGGSKFKQQYLQPQNNGIYTIMTS